MTTPFEHNSLNCRRVLTNAHLTLLHCYIKILRWRASNITQPCNILEAWVMTREFCTLYCVWDCVITSWHTRGGAAEKDAVGKQQLKQTKWAASWSGCNRGTAAEVDAVGEQQLKRTQSGCSLVWPRELESSACQRHYRTRLLVVHSRGLRQTHTDMVEEVRPRKHITVPAAKRELLCVVLC